MTPIGAMLDDLEQLYHELEASRPPRIEIWVTRAAPPGDDQVGGYELNCAAASILPIDPRSEKVLLLHPAAFLRLAGRDLLPPGAPVYDPAVECQKPGYQARCVRKFAAEIAAREGAGSLRQALAAIAQGLAAQLWNEERVVPSGNPGATTPEDPL